MAPARVSPGWRTPGPLGATAERREMPHICGFFTRGPSDGSSAVIRDASSAGLGLCIQAEQQRSETGEAGCALQPAANQPRIIRTSEESWEFIPAASGASWD